MKTLSVREARSALGKLDQMLEEEGEIVITRRGRPIARILPSGDASHLPSREELRLRVGPLATPSEVLLREERDER